MRRLGSRRRDRHDRQAAAARASWDCVIVTGDRDSLQLIDEHVTVKLVSSKLSQTVAVNYDPARFREEYGFEPIHLIDLKALMGDSSDNIPGVAGVGPKTATQLLLDYGTLDGDLRASGRDQGQAACQARTGQGQRLSCPTIWRRSAAKRRSSFRRKLALCSSRMTIAALYELFARLEFTRLIARYGLHAPQETAEARHDRWRVPAQARSVTRRRPGAQELGGSLPERTLCKSDCRTGFICNCGQYG